MKKILIVSTVSRQFYLFEQGNIEVLKSLGYEVHAAANFSDENERLNALDIIKHPFDIQRSPFSFKNIKAYKQLQRIMKEENFDIVHCHSPMGGVLTRLSAKSVGLSPVIYTAHGFHFYKGAPFINWLLYYPIEKCLSRYTDVLITINQEDYRRAKLLKAKNVKYIPGVGVDTNKFNVLATERDKKREELKLPKDAFVILSVGELNRNKNHEVIIKGLSKLNNPNIYYIICGQGDKEGYLKQLISTLGLTDKVKLLGYRNDVSEIYKTADIFAFPSFREGLSVSLMEAMVVGLPVICSEIRGNTDLIKDGIGGYIKHPKDVDGFTDSIEKLISEEELRKEMGNRNLKEVKRYDKTVVKEQMNKLYKTISS